MDKPFITIKIEPSSYKERHIILIKFVYNSYFIELLKTIDCSWSKTKKCWIIENNRNNLKKIFGLFKGKAILDYSAFISRSKHQDSGILNVPPKIEETKAFKRKINLSKYDITLINNFVKYLYGKLLSESTVRTYYIHVLDLLIYLKGKPTQEICNRDVELFIEDFCIMRRYSVSTHRQVISAIKQFKSFYPDCKIDELDLYLPRKTKYLPTILSKEEIISLLRFTKNLKHRAILALIYSTGLRVGEPINLELCNIDINRNQLIVKNGKGRKDRYVMLAKSFIPLLQNYLSTYNPKKYFAEGTEPGIKYTAVSIRSFLKRSCFEANITKRVTPYTLRHSYATHLLENGVDLRYIQELLGHSKPETTMIYTHVATKTLLEIESPLDGIVKNMIKSDNDNEKLALSGDYSL